MSPLLFKNVPPFPITTHNTSGISVTTEVLIQADGCDGLTKWNKAIMAKDKEIL